jgi:hypothetical protein
LASGELIDVVTVSATGAGSHTYTIPNDKALLANLFFNQFLVSDPQANNLGFALSRAGRAVIGN